MGERRGARGSTEEPAMRARWMAMLAHMRAYAWPPEEYRADGVLMGCPPRWFEHGAVKDGERIFKGIAERARAEGAAYVAARGDAMGSGWRMRSGRVLLSGKSGAVRMVIYYGLS